VADRKITDLTALTTPASADVLPIVDVSEAAAADKNKKITVGELLRGAPDGTAAAPSFAFESDGGNGMFLGGTDILAFSTGGSQAVTIDASQRVGIGTTSPYSLLDLGSSLTGQKLSIYADATYRIGLGALPNEFRQYTHQGGFISWGHVSTSDQSTFTERARIDSSGSLLVGTISARTNINNESWSGNVALNVEGANAYGTAVNIVNNYNGNGYSFLNFLKSNTTSVGSNTIVSNGNTLGLITFQGNDGTEFVQAAAISAVVDTTPGANDMPGRLVFSTTSDGASSPTERLRITSAGLVGIGTSTPAHYLHVSASVNDAVTNIVNTDTTNGYGLSVIAGGSASNRYIARFADAGNNAKAIILANGNVGIGTSTVTGFSDYTTVQLESSSSGSALRLVASGDTPGTDDFVIYKNTSGSYLRSYGDPIVFYGSSSEYGRWDTSGRLLVGTASSYAVGSGVGAKFQSSDTTSNIHASFTDWSTSDSGGIIALGKAKGGSAGNYTIVANGNTLGEIRFAGADGTDLQTNGASIRAEVDGTPGTNDMPARLVFSTTADGASSPTERMRINSLGEFFVYNVYDATTASAANVFVASSGRIVRSTSSGKYKTDIETLQDSYADALLSCRPVWYRSTCEGDNPSHGWWGFIAEEVAEIDPRLVHWKTTEITYDEKGSAVETPCEPEPEGVANMTALFPI
jgi:hypothetical protein